MENLRKAALRVAAMAAAAALATPALAHHSYSMFDRNRTLTLTGVVKVYQWTNPHAWVQLVAPGPNGADAEWALEMQGGTNMSRQGWSRSTLKAGDKITVTVHPLRDGQIGGSLISATLPDGRVLGPKEAASGPTPP